jgi:hypothetical protein
MADYTHSGTFASLKKIKEEISGNYTTYQLLSTLDFFLESAIDPIVTAWPDWLDNYYGKVVAWQAIKPSVKFSRNPKEILAVNYFNAITAKDDRTKRLWQREMHLNRGILFGLLNLWLKTTAKFMQLHNPLFPIKTTHRKLLVQLHEDRCSPYLHAILQTIYWNDKAHWFKKLIMEKYVRLALMNAKRTYEEVHFRKDLDDTIQTFLMYMSKAIDRCDSRQGVLTTFIQTWFFSAKAEIKKQIASEDQSSYEELLESGGILDFTEADTSFEAVQHLSSVAKELDPIGAIRFLLGIPEIVSSIQRKALTANKVAQITL